MTDPKMTVAIHEAGHAVVASVLGYGVERLSINPAAPDTEDGGKCDVLPQVKPNPLKQAAYRWGGAAAEMLYAPQQDWDRQPAAWASDISLFGQATGGDDALAEAARELAKQTLQENWHSVWAVAEALMENQVMSAADLLRILVETGASFMDDEPDDA